MNSSLDSPLDIVKDYSFWLKKRGFTNIGIIGTSPGSCVSFLAFGLEPGFKTAVFNHALWTLYPGEIPLYAPGWMAYHLFFETTAGLKHLLVGVDFLVSIG